MKQREDSKKRLRIQFMDLFVLAFIVLCLIGLMVRAGTLGIFKEKVELDEYRVRFCASNIAATSVDAFVIGDTFTLVSYHEALGIFTEIESVTPAVVYVEDDQNKIIRAEYPEGTRVDLYGIVETKGTVGEGGFLLDGTLSVSPGVEYRVQTEHMDVIIKIIDIEKR